MATGCVNYKTEWNTAIAIEVLMEHRRAVWKLWAASHDLFIIIIIIMIIIFLKIFLLQIDNRTSSEGTSGPNKKVMLQLFDDASITLNVYRSFKSWGGG